MNIRYTAIPLLVYVPQGHDFAARGEEYIEPSLCDHLRLIGLRPLLAEDYDNAIVHETPESDLSAEIHKVCPFRPDGSSNPISPITETRHQDPIDHALSLLEDLGASYELPGYINIEKDGIDFAFGDINGDYSYDFSLDPENRGIREGGTSTLPRHASGNTLAHWIRDEVNATCQKYKVDGLPDQHLHLNAIVPMHRTDLLIAAGAAGLLACDPQDGQVLIYEEQVEDSPMVREFALTHGLELIGTDITGSRHPYPKPPDTPRHTPGPWHVTDQNADGNLWVLDSGPDQSCIVAIITDNNIDGISHQTANARLIAAAPQLLDALTGSFLGDIERLARSAIAQATGQS
jgi:hypothetical protein